MDIRTLPVTKRHAATALREPLAHKDPFDKFLMVQAQLEQLRLLTGDSQLTEHRLAIAA